MSKWIPRKNSEATLIFFLIQWEDLRIVVNATRLAAPVGTAVGNLGDTAKADFEFVAVLRESATVELKGNLPDVDAGASRYPARRRALRAEGSRVPTFLATFRRRDRTNLHPSS